MQDPTLGNEERIWQLVDRHGPDFIELSDRVWEMPELNFHERRSMAEHRTMLERHGARVTEGLAGIPTAVMGEWGEGGPVIAILGEYDALPGLSNEAGVAEHRPRAGEGSGHGCGHNLLGAGAMLAAAAVKDWLLEQGIQGRVRYYGCPAEEGGAAKTFMVRDGCFADVDAAISWHPAPFAGVNEAYSLAILQVDYAFTGKAAHDLWLAGSQRRLGWALGFAAQVLWLLFGLLSSQYGFIASALAYGAVYARNWWRGRPAWIARKQERIENERVIALLERHDRSTRS